MSTITDNVIAAPMDKVIGCYDNVEVLGKVLPDFYDVQWKGKVTDTKGILLGKQKFPWPMYPRDMAMTVTGAPDYKNHALLSVSQSVNPGEKFFDYEIQEPEEGFVRLHAHGGYNYFQYLGPNKTRHITIWNTDPKIDYLPTALLNNAMTVVLYGLMTNLEKYSIAISDQDKQDEDTKEFRMYFNRKIPYYNLFMERILDFENSKNKFIRIRDCPNHPANPNHPQHEPDHQDNWKTRFEENKK